MAEAERLAASGWELVGVAPIDSPVGTATGTTAHAMYFRRSITDAAAQAVRDATSQRFDVCLVDVTGGQISVIKEVRELTGLGLAEAKHLVDSVGSTHSGIVVLRSVEETFARYAKEQLEAAGAVVQVSGPS